MADAGLMDDEDNIDFDEYEEYCRQVRESKGFDVGNFSFDICGQIYPMRSDMTKLGNPKHWNADSEAYFHAQLALYLYNYLKNSNHKFVGVEKATNECTPLSLNYITFKACDPSSGLLETFQTMTNYLVRQNGSEMNIWVEFCLKKPADSCGDSGREPPPEKRHKPEDVETVHNRVSVLKGLAYMEMMYGLFLDCIPSGSSDDKFLGFKECPEYIEKVLEFQEKGYNVGNIRLLSEDAHGIDWLHLYAELALYNEWEKGRLKGAYQVEEIEKIYMQTNGESERNLTSKTANFYMTFKAKEVDKGSVARFHVVIRRLVREEDREMWLQLKSCRIDQPC